MSKDPLPSITPDSILAADLEAIVTAVLETQAIKDNDIQSVRMVGHLDAMFLTLQRHFSGPHLTSCRSRILSSLTILKATLFRKVAGTKLATREQQIEVGALTEILRQHGLPNKAAQMLVAEWRGWTPSYVYKSQREFLQFFSKEDPEIYKQALAYRYLTEEDLQSFLRFFNDLPVSNHHVRSPLATKNLLSGYRSFPRLGPSEFPKD